MGPTRKPTKYEQERIEKMLRLGCAACAYLELWCPAEVHHILDGGHRMGHWFTIPLCPGHHRGVWSPEQLEIVVVRNDIEIDWRIAISDGRKAFIEVYPSERDFWFNVQGRLHLPAIWPVSKIIPRRSA